MMGDDEMAGSIRATLVAIVMAFSAETPLMAQTTPAPPSPDVLKELAPSGRLRAAINLGNAVLAQGTAQEPKGITVDLSRELARRTGLPLDLVPFDAAGKVFDALKAGAWDVAFIAIEPARAAEIEFSPPYVLIEGTYMVRTDSPLKVIEDVDKAGIRISVGRGSAYDLFLTRTLKAAELVRSPSGGCCSMVEMFLADKLDVVAGVRQQLEPFATPASGLRVMDGRFQVIRQAMAVPKGRLAAAAYVRDFVEDMKASGFVKAGLDRSGQTAAAVAPKE
jgi:polar amino acid transport system substrate-binding protein